MTTEPRIVLTDIDGTLVNFHGKVPESAVAAIRQARANGHQVYLCSGRSRAEIYPEMWDIGVDGFIGGNGSYIEHDGAVIHHQVLAPDVVDRAMSWLDETKLGYYVECNSGLFASDNFLPKAASIFGVPNAETIRRTIDLLEGLTYLQKAPNDDVNKISFVLEPWVDLAARAVEFDGEAKIDSWSGTGVRDDFGEIGQIGIHKAVAVEKLASHLGVDSASMIAIGDARNDLELFALCGTSVAMGNAMDDVKDAATYVTAHIDDDGYAKAYAQLGLI